MLRSIRRGVFETNSSSTHSITICSQEEYDKFQNGELLLSDSDEFLTKEQAVEKLKNDKWFIKYHPDFNFENEEEVNEALAEEGYKNYERYLDNDYLENFHTTYTSKSGETIVAFGQYGYDG